MSNTFTLKLKSTPVLEDNATVFTGNMFRIGLLGVAFGDVKILNKNMLEVTHNGQVNKIRTDLVMGPTKDFIEVYVEELQRRLGQRVAELELGGGKIIKMLTKFENLTDALSRENTYAEHGIKLIVRRVLRDDEPVMEYRLETEFRGLKVVTTDTQELLVAIASIARAYTATEYSRYSTPDPKWNNTAEEPKETKTAATGINVGTIAHVSPSLRGSQLAAAMAAGL